jgi:GDSL-like lipase/acylhydrolase family protein
MRAKELVTNLLVIAVTLLVLFLISEITLRIYTRWSLIYDIEMSRYATEIKDESPNPRIGHVHRPNTEGTLMGVPVKINSDGFRDRDYPVERNESFRIIFLGDSLTFGWGVEKSRTFKDILEAEASRNRATEIINFGTGNYNTEQEVNLFIEKGLKYQPDEVVVFYFINDAEPTPRKSNWDFLAASRTLTFFWSRIKSVIANFEPNKSFSEYYSGLYADGQPGWIAAKSAFLQLRDVCARQGIALRVVLLPELHELQNYPFVAEHGKVLAFLQHSNISAMDLVSYFAGEPRPMRLWVGSDDAHPNEIAHAMIAKYARDFILEGINGRQ